MWVADEKSWDSADRMGVHASDLAEEVTRHSDACGSFGYCVITSRL